VSTTFDPFDAEIVVSDVHEMIMQHFGGKDLIQMSEVSPAWCDQVEGKVSEKVELRCTANGKQVASIYNEILLSARSYKNISIQWVASLKPFKVLERFAPCLENLEINGSNDASIPFPFIFIEFPRLKCLKLDNVSLTVEKWIIQCLWAANIQLEELHVLVPGHSDRSSFRDTMRFILTQRNLKRLTISGDFDDDDYDYIGELDMTSLINEIGEENIGLGNVEEFDYHWANPELYYSAGPDLSNAMEMMNFMPNLRHLKLRKISFASEAQFILDETEFPHLVSIAFDNSLLLDDDVIDVINTKIKKLEFEHCYNKLKPLLLSLKGLKEIKFNGRWINHIDNFYDYANDWTKELMEFAAVNMEKLEVIRTDENCEEAEQHYEQMKGEREDINKNIRFVRTMP
jgi:hypothetical protein